MPETNSACRQHVKSVAKNFAKISDRRLFQQYLRNADTKALIPRNFNECQLCGNLLKVDEGPEWADSVEKLAAENRWVKL